MIIGKGFKQEEIRGKEVAGFFQSKIEEYVHPSL